MNEQQYDRIAGLLEQAASMDEVRYQQVIGKMNEFRKLMSEKVKTVAPEVNADSMQAMYSVVLNDHAVASLHSEDEDASPIIDPSTLMSIGFVLGSLTASNDDDLARLADSFPTFDEINLALLRSVDKAFREQRNEGLLDSIMAKMPTRGGVQ